MKKLFIRIISGLMPTSDMRRKVRNVLSVGFGRTKNKGKNNKIIWIDAGGKRHDVHRLPGCYIDFRGDNNYIEIHGDLHALRMDIRMEGDSKIFMQPSPFNNRNLKISGMKNSVLKIGKNFLMDGLCTLVFATNTNITIGDDCMVAANAYIRSGDGHSVFSAETNEIINKNADVYIGNHVWLAKDCFVFKGVYLADGCLVGARSLVTKKFTEPCCAIAGNPAHLIKTGVKWDKQPVE